MDLIALLTISAFAALLLFYLGRMGRAWLKARGLRVVTCPETQAPAAVELDAGHAALTAAVVGVPDLALKSCSRWSGRPACGQDCLPGIAAAPADCLVRMLAARWFEGKTCVYCHVPIDMDPLLGHNPALMLPGDPGRVTTEWPEIPPDHLPAALATHVPVCWDCHVTETFRRRFPQLVIDNPEPAAHAERPPSRIH
jgi:hypothetical protein